MTRILLLGLLVFSCMFGMLPVSFAQEPAKAKEADDKGLNDKDPNDNNPENKDPAQAKENHEAKTAGKAKDDKDIPVVVVTARRNLQDLFQVDRSIQTLGADDILELQSQSLPDALEESTGVFVQRTNRGAGSPIMRGLVGPQNLILIDGIRFNNSTFRTGPNQYLALIEPTSIERMEVLLGPGSVLYGSDAVGGVLQAFPRAWSDDKQGLGARLGGRFFTPDLSSAVWADLSWQNPRLAFMAGGAFRNFGTLTAGDGVTQPLSDYQQGAWRARARYRMSDDMELAVTYLGARVRDAGRTDRLYEGRFRFYDNDDDFLYLDWRYRPKGVFKSIRLAASFHRMNELVDRYRCSVGDQPTWDEMQPCLKQPRVGYDSIPSDPLTRQDLVHDAVLTPGLLATANLGFFDNRLRVSAGMEAYADFISSDKQKRTFDSDNPWVWKQQERGNYSQGSRYLSTGAFVLAEGELYSWDGGVQALSMNLGGRISNFSASAPDVPGLGDVDYSHTGFVGTAGLKYLMDDTFMAYANFSQGFRAPNLQETTVLGDTGSKFEIPNADLAPERSNTLELGTRTHLDKVRFFLSAFFSFMDDFIDERDVPESEWRQLGLDPEAVGDKPVVQRVNSSKALYWGMEGSLRLGPWFGIEPWLRASWVRAEVHPDSGEVYPARRVPPAMGAAGVRYENREYGFFVEFFTRFAGTQWRLHPSDEKDLRICQDPANLGDTYADSGQACPGTPAWFTLNLRGGYRYSEQVRVDVSALNLTNELYRYHGSGVDAPGIGVAVSVEARY